MRLRLAIVLAMAIAACGGGLEETTDTSTAASTTTEAAPATQAPISTTSTTEGGEDPTATAVVGTTETSLGTVLVDSNGMTLYIFTVDQGDISSCYGACEDAWPVVPAGASPADGVEAATGATSRDDGSAQLTINNRPVYLFAGDAVPGDVNGQGVNDVWFVIGGDGEPIDGEVMTAETELGTILVDEDGLTLYIFTVDVDSISACYDQCEDAWPVVAAGALITDGIQADRGFTTREDGSEQLTINGRPVYLFAGDGAPGDVNGQGLNDVWYVLGTDGEPISG